METFHKAVIVYDSLKGFGSRYTHNQLASACGRELTRLGIMCFYVDMADQTTDYEKFMSITDPSPDLLVSFDLAGFHLYTETNDYSYNIIPCRMAHILLCPSDSYEPVWENHSFNFSMFFYTLTAHDSQCLMERYPQVDNWRTAPELKDGLFEQHMVKLLEEISV